jgi:hypothetical protein
LIFIPIFGALLASAIVLGYPVKEYRKRGVEVNEVDDGNKWIKEEFVFDD